MQKARRHHLADAPTACRRTVSGTISLPYLGCFSPFPYGTGSLSVSEEYLALPDGAGRLQAGFLRSRLTQGTARPTDNLYLTGLSPAMAQLSRRFSLMRQFLNAALQPHGSTPPWFGLFPFRSPLLRESLLFSFPLPT